MMSRFPRPTEVQSILFAKDAFSLARAKQWAKAHSFRYGLVDETANTWRLRQFAPEQATKGTFRTIRLDDGVQAVIAMPRKNPPLSWHLEHDDLHEILQGLCDEYGYEAVADALEDCQ